MPTLTEGEETLLRTHPHSFKEYLAVLQPGTILACLLNGAPTGDPVTEIAFDNVSEGAWANVVHGMTLWVGSAAGLRDKGTCRIRKAAGAAALYIGEESGVDWTDNDHLTVVENYELWLKYPRVVVNGSLVFYKDWETAYGDQHENWPPVAIMGPPECAFIDAGTGKATGLFVGEHSYIVAPGAAMASYAWGFPSGTPNTKATAGTDAAPHSITWDTAGTYWTTLTVTDDNGKLHSGRRPVFIFNRTGAGAPYTLFKISNRQSDINSHGHTTSFVVEGDADQAEFPDGALVVYFTEDWYGSTKGSIGGTYTGRAHVKFVGYIQKETTTKDPDSGNVTFDAVTINTLMDNREAFSCWIKNKGSVSDWTEATNLTADRAALSLIRNHSTLLDICDVLISGDTQAIKSQEFAAKTSLLQQLQQLYDSLFAHVACSKQGRLYLEKDPQMLPVADRAAIDVIVTLGHADWRDRLDLPRPQESRTSFVNLFGVHYPGYPHAVQPVLSKAPGDAPLYQGKTKEVSGLILEGQSDGNEKAGFFLARDNNEFPDVTVPMPGLWDVFDIVPQEYIQMNLAAPDTKRGIVWSNQKLIPRRIELAIEETRAGRVPMVTIHVEKDSFGPSGVDGDYPDEVPETSPSLMPTPSIPPLPPDEGETGDGNSIYFSDYNGDHLFFTANAKAVSADVLYRDCGVIGAAGSNPIHFALNPWDDVGSMIVACQHKVYRTDDLGLSPTWTDITPVGASPTDHYYWHICGSICQKDLLLLCGYYNDSVHGTWYPKAWVTKNGGVDWALVALTANEGKWCAGEMSAHRADYAWAVFFESVGGLIQSVKSININGVAPTWAAPVTLWAGASDAWMCPPYHRYFDNDDDLVGLWAGENGSAPVSGQTKMCAADQATCTEAILGAFDPRWLGGYTWGSEVYWVVADNKLFVSADGISWGLRYTGVGHVSGFPYDDQFLISTQGGVVAPLLISEDQGNTFTEKEGNWADFSTNGDIRCATATWTA